MRLLSELNWSFILEIGLGVGLGLVANTVVTQFWNWIRSSRR